MGDFFYRLGRFVGPAARRGRWMWLTLVGAEGDEIRAEHAVGADLARGFAASLGVDGDARLARKVESIGRSLASRLRDRRRTFRFVVAAGDEANALALPGGFVFVTRPLLDLCGEDPDEIAFVLGHEMAHVVRKHAIDRVLQSRALAWITRAGTLGSGAPASGALGKWVRRGGASLLLHAYSRDQEFDADELGVRLARSAGFDPGAALRLLARLGGGGSDGAGSDGAGSDGAGSDGAGSDGAGSDGAGPAHWFADHPPVRERIRRIERVRRS